MVQTNTISENSTQKKASRLVALDIFRGLTVAVMILVNNPGDWSTTFAPLLHSKWNGCTFTDLIFPFFLLIVGFSISLSLKKFRYGPKVLPKIMFRSLTIFSLGVFLAAFPNFGFPANHPHLSVHYLILALVLIALFTKAALPKEMDRQKSKKWKKALNTFLIATLAVVIIMGTISYLPYSISHVHLPGVLQRIALVYGICAVLYCYTSWRFHLFLGIGISLLYWVIMLNVPVPGYGQASLAPMRNLAWWTDHYIINHLYYLVTGNDHHWSTRHLAEPEGFLTTIPAVVTGILGLLAGQWMSKENDNYRKVSNMMIAGAILIALGLLWSYSFPINKRLWSSSYVFYSGGIAIMVFAIIFWLGDILHLLNRIKPLALPFGTNALFIYLFSEMLTQILDSVYWTQVNGQAINVHQWIYYTFFSSWLSPYIASLLYAVTFLLLAWLLAMMLYRNRIFIKV